MAIAPPALAQTCGRWLRTESRCTITGGTQCPAAPDTCCTDIAFCEGGSVGSSFGSFSQFVPNFLQAISPNFKLDLATPGGFISALLPYLLVFAGLIFFIMLLTSGFQLLTAVGSPDQAEAAKKRLTTAIFGFLLLFAAYWLAQLLQVVLGINILK